MPAPKDLAELSDPGSLIRVLLDRMAEGASLAREDGTIVHTNPALDAMFGHEPGALRGRPLAAQEGLPPGESARAGAAVMARLRDVGDWEGEWRHVRRDGTPFATRARIAAVDIGGARHWLCLQSEATDSAAARDLAEERARLQIATEAAEIGIWDWDLVTGRRTFSPLARAIWGLPPEGQVGVEEARAVVHPEDRERTWAQAARALDPLRRDRSPYEFRVVHSDGAVRWVLARGEAIFGEGPDGPRALRYLGTLQDITARRVLEEAERAATQQLRLALAAGAMGVWDADAVTRTVTGSSETYRLLGFPEGGPMPVDEVNARYAPGEFARAAGEISALLARGITSGSDVFRYLHPDRGEIWLGLRYEVLLEEGRPRRVLGVIADESERRAAEAQVRASEAELRALADALPLLVSLVDRDERYRFMNRAHEDWFGRPVAEMLGRPIGEVLGAEAYAPRAPHIAAALGGTPSRVEVMTPSRDGTRRDTEVHYIPRRAPDGRVDGLYAVVLDLTEQKAAQAALDRARAEAERQAQRTGAILGQLAEAVVVVDASGRVTYVNEAANRLQGLAGAALRRGDAAATLRFLTEDGRPHPPDELPLARAARRGESVEFARWRIRRPDGREILAAGSARPILSPEGRPDGAVLTFRDDTARAAAEDRLRRLNQDLEAEVALRTAERDRIWQNSTDLMAVFGFDGMRRAINPAWTQLLGFDEAALLDIPFMEITHPEDRPRLRAAVERLRRGERVTDFEDRLRCADGSYRTISWTGVPGEGLFYAIGRDVTAQRAAEEQLRQSQKMEALGQLTGGISHDFNNLLQAVQGSFALILKRPGNAEAVQDLARHGLQATRRGGSLASQLLAFSRAQRLEVRPVRLGEALEGMRDLLSRSLGPRVEVALAPVDPDLVAQVDPTQLEMAVLNLAINARDAMPEGGTLAIAARARAVAADVELAPGDYVLVEVTDVGTGMAPDVARRAFEPFFTTKGLGRGTGLGLSQVYAMARQSGGTVRLDTAPGRGTRVGILLPRAPAAAVPPADPERAAPGPQGPGPAPATILVVDDDEDVRRWLATALADLGHRVIEAASGPEGLARLPDGPDLLLVDFAMPGMTGAEVVRAARAILPRLPIVLATGYADTGAVEAVADPDLTVLRKPFELAELEEVLRRRLPAARPITIL